MGPQCKGHFSWENDEISKSMVAVLRGSPMFVQSHTCDIGAPLCVKENVAKTSGNTDE